MEIGHGMGEMVDAQQCWLQQQGQNSTVGSVYKVVIEEGSSSKEVE